MEYKDLLRDIEELVLKYKQSGVNVEEIQDLLGVNKYFYPKEDREYYLVDVRGEVNKLVNRSLQEGSKHFENNELFRTKEEAEEHAKKQRFLLKMKRDFLDNSDVIDWKDGGQEKHCLRYFYQTNTIDLACDLNIKNTDLYTTNEDWLRDYVKEHEEEIKKYYFEIEE